MSSRLRSLILGAAVAAGAVGVGLEVAGVGSPARAVLVLLFLAVAPTTAIAGLLRTLDGFARLIIACTASIVILALTAIVMLAGHVWSPTGGVLAVAAITAACLVAQLPLFRRRGTARAGPAGAVAKGGSDAPAPESPVAGEPQAAAATGLADYEDDAGPAVTAEDTGQAGRPARR
jgi:hypothetical protein